jgi:TetR/AcrR family transcriptional repressor of uid operon
MSSNASAAASASAEKSLGDRLLSAATEVFAEKGYSGAGVAEIARRAGVTTGAIYSRYRGKDDLLAAAIEAATSNEFDSLFSDHRFEGRMEDVLRIAGSHLVERSRQGDGMELHAPGMLLESFVAARHEPTVRAFLQERMIDRRDRLAEIVEAAKASGGIDAEIDTDSLVTFCHAVGLGFLLLEVLDPPMPDEQKWERLIGRLLASVGDPSAFSAVTDESSAAQG